MKTTRKTGFLLLAALLPAGLLAAPARAGEAIAGNNVVVSTERVRKDDLAVAGSNVQVLAKVEGDVTAAGANVTIAGGVTGDVLAAGANLNVAGPVGDDLRAFGATVTVTGPVADNAMLAGGTVSLTSGARIGRDAEISGGEVTVQAPVRRNLRLAAGRATLASEVGGTVTAHVERLTLSPGAVVRGSLVVTGPQAPVVSPGAKVLGRVDYRPAAAPGRSSDGVPGSNAGWPVWWAFRFLSIWLLGAVALALFPAWPGRVAATLRQRTGGSLLAGLLALVVVPVAALLLMVTLIGLPLAFVLLALYGATVLLAGAFVAYPLGGWLLRQFRRGSPSASPYAQLAIGALALSLLASVPFAGGLVRFLVLLAGTGALFLERRDALGREREQQPPALRAAPAEGLTA